MKFKSLFNSKRRQHHRIIRQASAIFINPG